ncbi:MAG TPA: hypothetical protein VHZ75_06680 [Solirubrobacteraceae bacterium]|jgi:hypothetical protein|nr:hypothetical protein [Solirubrobacteraceae bacterium]
MSLMISTILAAAEAEKSHTPFFIAGGVLVAFAVCVSMLGMRQPDFPSSAGAARGVMALGVALVAATMGIIVYVST